MGFEKFNQEINGALSDMKAHHKGGFEEGWADSEKFLFLFFYYYFMASI